MHKANSVQFILCHPLLLLPSVFPSIRVSSSHQVAKVLKFQLQHQSVFPMKTQDWFPLGWTGWISLQSNGLSRIFSQHHSSKVSILWCSESQLVGLFFFFKCPVLGYSICLNSRNGLKIMKVILKTILEDFLSQLKCARTVLRPDYSL